MKKLFVGMIIGLGLVFGIGFTSEVSAYDDYAEMTDEEFAMHVRDTHIERDLCTEEHTVCMECNGYFCDNLTCWCGEEIPNVAMTFEEFYAFEEYVYDMYVCEYCVNYCEDCDNYYYAECMCEAIENGCGSDCIDCLAYDYEIFVEDYYEMIMDEYYEVIRGIVDERARANEVEIVICEF